MATDDDDGDHHDNDVGDDNDAGDDDDDDGNVDHVYKHKNAAMQRRLDAKTKMIKLLVMSMLVLRSWC